jgi:5-methylthioribose kinase
MERDSRGRGIIRPLQLDDASLPDYLRRAGLASATDAVRVEPAGDGNINYVRRVRMGSRSFVVKHARERLERFPEYSAPSERIVFEHRYGEVVRARCPELAGILPTIVAFDPESRVLVMEDLGQAPRLDDELTAGRVPEAALEALGLFLARVHGATRADAPALATRFPNDALRTLHGEHIYSLPFQPNDFPIAPRVRARLSSALARRGVRERIAALRRDYYERAEALVHADVQAGNLLVQGERLRLLDAEIAHVGDPAFDLGTALAHLRFHAALRPGDPEPDRAQRSLVLGYRKGGTDDAVFARARGHAAVEMLRRAAGAARPSFLLAPEPAERVIACAEEWLA